MPRKQNQKTFIESSLGYINPAAIPSYKLFESSPTSPSDCSKKLQKYIHNSIVTDESYWGGYSANNPGCYKTKKGINCKYIIKTQEIFLDRDDGYNREAYILKKLAGKGITPKMVDNWECYFKVKIPGFGSSRTLSSVKKNFNSSDHRNIFNSDLVGYIVSEKWDGIYYDLVMTKDKKIYEDDLKKIIKIVLKMHSLGIVHNDLHSQNIVYRIRNGKRQFALIDFGTSYDITREPIGNFLLRFNESVSDEENGMYTGRITPSLDFVKMREYFLRYMRADISKYVNKYINPFDLYPDEGSDGPTELTS